MEISGVDINSSRQSFNCPILLEPDFCHLADAAWALIAHEKLATVDPKLGLFNPENPWANEPLETRLARYTKMGKALNPADPTNLSNLPDLNFTGEKR
jgi:hypothetical protein